jgi:hypothetical protein
MQRATSLIGLDGSVIYQHFNMPVPESNMASVRLGELDNTN